MQATKFVESYFDAWNHRDPVAVADHLSADGLYINVPENAKSTHDELIATLKDFFALYKHRYELIGEVATGENTVAFQYRMCPIKSSRHTESRTAFTGAEFISLHGDTALTIMDYYDQPAEQPTEIAEILTSKTRKYAKSGLCDEQLNEYKSRLQHIMHADQAYLQPDLTLPKLADEIECSVNHLSQVINAGFGMSFFEYLNKFRIEHAKGLLLDLDPKHNAVLNIAFTVGFNSNSAFYAAFKKHVGKTPAQFRRSSTA